MKTKQDYEKGTLFQEYQGWTNSATWSVAYLIMQERPIYEKLVAIVKARPVTGLDIKECWITMKHAPKDTWTHGAVNYQEIADTHFNNEDYGQPSGAQ